MPRLECPGKVLVPYKITLLSNALWASKSRCKVLVPYKITLLSNHIGGGILRNKF